jgi:hypothetical protein
MAIPVGISMPGVTEHDQAAVGSPVRGGAGSAACIPASVRGSSAVPGHFHSTGDRELGRARRRGAGGRGWVKGWRGETGMDSRSGSVRAGRFPASASASLHRGPGLPFPAPPRRTGYVGFHINGSGGGLGKRTDREVDTAPRPDLTQRTKRSIPSTRCQGHPLGAGQGGPSTRRRWSSWGQGRRGRGRRTAARCETSAFDHG